MNLNDLPILKKVKPLDLIIQKYVLRALKTNYYNKSWTAAQLGISLRSLRMWVNSWKIPIPRYTGDLPDVSVERKHVQDISVEVFCTYCKQSIILPKPYYLAQIRRTEDKKFFCSKDHKATYTKEKNNRLVEVLCSYCNCKFNVTELRYKQNQNYTRYKLFFCSPAHTSRYFKKRATNNEDAPVNHTLDPDWDN